MKKLLLDTYPLKKIVEGNYLYVDKTDLIAEMVSFPEAQLFFSRPRRFGKSMLLNIIKSIFQDEPSLFAGLKIMTSGYKFIKRPVIRLDMSIDSTSPEALDKSLFAMLNAIARDNGFALEKNFPPGSSLKALIDAFYDPCSKVNLMPEGDAKEKTKELAKATDRLTPVVLLIDEYDFPINSKLNNPSLAKENSEILHDFYASLKTASQDGKLHFTLLTGVTRYAMMGISAGLNNLKDISFDPKYAALCGFTYEELDEYYTDFFPLVLKETISDGTSPANFTLADLRQKVLDFYDSYSWDGRTKILNPYSIVHFFDEKKFSYFWSNTGSSLRFLTHVFGNSPNTFLPGNMTQIEVADCKSPILVDDPPTIPLLLQTGYLTINEITTSEGVEYYNLVVPNKEVARSVAGELGKVFFSERLINKNAEKNDMTNAILGKNAKDLTKIMNSFFNGVVHVHQAKYDGHDPPETESYYHCMLWAYFKGLFKNAEMEVPGSVGNLDLIVNVQPKAYAVIEIKYEKSTKEVEVEEEKPAQKKKITGKKVKKAAPNDINKTLNDLAMLALDTIEKKRYGLSYRVPGNTVIDIGVGIYGRGESLAIFEKTE
ncbi:MAG: AAA family ATPase [Deltaproteobacteria bacterium]|jgi:hypothetical protein|nr:AAA family ATPase [Deltaproteobacteria bacterium]